MDIQTTLKEIVNTDEPLLKFESIFGDATLENLLQRGFGEALCNCLSEFVKGWSLIEMLKDKEESVDNRPILSKYVDILNAVIPVQNSIDIELDDNTKTCFKYHDVDAVDKVICKIIKPLFALFCENPHGIEMMSNVFLKAIFYASDATIKDTGDFFSKHLFSFVRIFLRPFCFSRSHTVITFLVILSRKMTQEWLQTILEPDVIFFIRFNVLRSGENMCPYVNNLKKLYFDLCLRNMIEAKVPLWNQLLEAQYMFQGQSLTMALQIVSELIGQKGLPGQIFIQSGILLKLSSLLCNPSEFGESTFVIKSFLSVFLNFETGPVNHYSWNSRL